MGTRQVLPQALGDTMHTEGESFTLSLTLDDWRDVQEVLAHLRQLKDASGTAWPLARAELQEWRYNTAAGLDEERSLPLPD